jgi:hypothetical protein
MDNNDLQINILTFYSVKLNDIFSSFMIKYFNKLKENYTTIKEFQQLLYDTELHGEQIDKGITLFDIYIDKKYKLSYDDLNTAIYIYIKESLQTLLNKKVSYKKSDDMLKLLFTKCFKNIACDLYENPDSVNVNLEFKKSIQNTVKNTIYNLIPFDYTIRYYNDSNNDSNNDTHNKTNTHKDNQTHEDIQKNKSVDSVKKYFYSDNGNSDEKSLNKNKKSNGLDDSDENIYDSS